MSVQINSRLQVTAARPARSRAFATVVQGWLKFALDIVIEYRRAKAAEDLYRHLSAMSDADLAQAGLRRGEIAVEVRRRLYSA